MVTIQDQTKVLRYYAKVNAKGETSYCSSGFGSGWASIGTPESLGNLLRREDYKKHPDAIPVNGPNPDWDQGYHSDCLGEFILRELTAQEEQELLEALRRKPTTSELIIDSFGN